MPPPPPCTPRSCCAAESPVALPSRGPASCARSGWPGLMASQIAAQLAIGLQVPVVMRDLDEDIAAKGLAGARDVVAQTAARGRLDEDTATTIAASLSATTDLAELAGCDLVIEAVPEVLEIKRSVFAELESVL